jgi:hypothetical protein
MERFCIVGTAPTWVHTPWTDAGLYIASLNDAYRLKGFVRADCWYDFHPLDKFFHVPTGATQILAHQVPAGYYVRPADHLDWLQRQSQTIPVWLHADYLTQHPEAATWPQAHAIPRAAIEAHFGTYFTSSPAVMLAHAVMQGAKEIHIYGIHLATEQEYIEQRPNFEFLCGKVLGKGKVTISVHQGIRRFETADGLIAIPEASPILSSPFRYAVDVRPRANLEPIKWDVHRYSVKRERAVAGVRQAPWYRRRVADDELWRCEALLADAQERLGRAQLHQQLMGA